MKPKALTNAELKRIANYHIASMCFWDTSTNAIAGLTDKECEIVQHFVEQHAIKLAKGETKNLGASIGEVAARVAGLPFDPKQVPYADKYEGVPEEAPRDIPPPPTPPTSRVLVEGKNPPLPPPARSRIA